ncbi:hypothetical protein GPJ56_001681 [Histomonas meleagridis]|uniref:uncharacterized protein n=1 Tax=Histomonas meleagridis TaxID=135588 RepID=UPI00355AC72B|nr:hypothetical protein GPJ56_001681 [Histomonas meleagridis]KAH0796233.1 hypothetical protein GO595_010126 [Histomonas meleagridis]
MSLNPEEQKELDELLGNISSLSKDLDNLDVYDVTKESAEIRKDIYKMQQDLVEPARMRHEEPKIDRKKEKSKKHARRHILPNERLFKEKPKNDEVKKGRVKLVYDDEEKIAYPLPNEVIPTEPKMIVATSLFFDFDGEKSDLKQGNLTFPAIKK